MTEHGPSTDLDPCPYCGSTSGVRVITNTPPKVLGWSCTPCGGQWWITVVNLRPWLDHLVATVELRRNKIVGRPATGSRLGGISQPVADRGSGCSV
jgi:hypothetical protein